jgi:shikimate dehydrogenase
MPRFGLLGYPLTHSFSQKYFTEKFADLGLEGYSYENFSVPDISGFKKILEETKDLKGFNITIPYKKQIIDFLDESSEVVSAIGACNCVKIDRGLLKGYNTDVFGFEQSLLTFLKKHHQKALVFGTGGASAAVLYVLSKLGIAYQSVSRTASEKSISYDQVDADLLATHHLLVNTTPLGMYPNVDDCPEIPYELLTEKHHLYDLIYNPSETKFLEKGRRQHASTQNGKEMLVLQAEESWRIWNS